MLRKVNGHWMFTEAAYSFGKKVVQVYIPASSALYFGLGNIWGFPAIESVVGSCAVVATFIGVCLGLSSSSYDKSEVGYDGDIEIHQSEETGKKMYSLNLKGDPTKIDEKDSVTFKVPKS